MIAGSETGAIIASSIVTESNKTPLFVDKAIEFFNVNNRLLYHDISMPLGLKLLFYVFIVGILSYFAYKSVYMHFYIDGFNERYLQIKDIIKLRKKQLKQRIRLDDVNQNRLKEMLD